MKVFIADGSKLGFRRLLMLLSDIKAFELVGYSAEVLGAVVSIDAIKPDLVILDLEMRNESGIQVLQNIKMKHPGTIFIIVTNASTQQYQERCRELGAEYFFDRSKEFQMIPDIVRDLGARFEQRKNGAGLD